MSSPFNGLKRLFARLTGAGTRHSKSSSQRKRKARVSLGVECLETRELMSASIPGFTLRRTFAQPVRMERS
jgi:hypothetical protein